MANFDPVDDTRDRSANTYDFTTEASPPSTAASSPGFEMMTEDYRPIQFGIKATPSLEDTRVVDASLLPLRRQDSPTSHRKGYESITPPVHAKGVTAHDPTTTAKTRKQTNEVELPAKRSTTDTSLASNADDASLVTPTQSYDTTPPSDDLQFAERSPSPLTSEQDSNDAYDTGHGLSSASSKDDDEHSDATESLDRVRQIASSDSNDQSPSRRSARIVSSGSSVQKALARRDELDAKLQGRTLGSSTPSSSQSSLAHHDTPPRRGPGRPRKHPLLPSPTPALASQSELQPPPLKRGPGRPRKSAPGFLQSRTLTSPPRLTRARSTSTMTLRRPSQRTRRGTPVLVSSSDDTEASASASPALSVKRSPGRPRKFPQISSLPRTAATLTAQAAPLRRPPGRPRKSAPAFIRSSDGHSVSDSPPKRGPGRPRKYPLVPSPTPAPAQETPVKRGPGRPRKSAPSTFAVPTSTASMRALRVRLSLPSGRRSARLSAASLTPKPERFNASSQSTPVAFASADSTPIKRGPGRPRKVIPDASPQPASPALTTASQDRSSSSANLDRAPSLKRSASNAFSTESEPPKRRGRPPGPERLRRLREEELARSRSGSEKLYSESSDILDDSMSELTDLSDDADDSGKATPSIAVDSAAAKKAKRISRQDKDRKRYYVTGLYAGETDAASSSHVQDSTVLPFPIHFGNRLLTEERDYELPFYLHQESEQLRARADARRKPPPYQQIKSNKYTSRPKLQGEITVCYCKPPSNCGADCMNRMTLFICDPKACPCGEACTNISLGKRDAIKTTVAHYGGRGFGLKTMEPIALGQFIDEYRGEVINLTEMTKRVNEEYMATGNFYLLEYDGAAGELLDGGRKGNITRFANHSCDPNCRIEKFTICGTDESLSAEFQIGLFALRDIKAGEELTYNYGWAAFQPRDINGVPTSEVPPMHCLCGAVNCVGVLGGKKVPPTKPNDKLTNGKKTRRKRRPKALTPKAAASLLAKVTQKQNEAGNSGLSRKVGVRETHRKKAETAVKLAVKVKLKRAARVQPSISSASSETPSEMRVQSSDGGEESTDEQPRPVVRKRGRPPKNAVLSDDSKSNSDASASKLTHRHVERDSDFGDVDHLRERHYVSEEPIPLSLASRRGAQVNVSPRGKSPQKANRGVKGLSYSAAAAVISDDDDWRDSSDSDDERNSAQATREISDAGTSKGKENDPPSVTKRRKRQPSKDSEMTLVERRARNAFLARVRRASKRGIVIEDPSQHPLRKISIPCTAAPENTYIPDLPSSLVSMGMSTADARRSRNAFLARVRRHIKRGASRDAAIEMAAKPLPGDPAYDTPVMQAQRAQMEQLQQEAAADLVADPSQLGSSVTGDDEARSPAWEDLTG